MSVVEAGSRRLLIPGLWPSAAPTYRQEGVTEVGGEEREESLVVS